VHSNEPTHKKMYKNSCFTKLKYLIFKNRGSIFFIESGDLEFGKSLEIRARRRAPRSTAADGRPFSF
jgi:hypothetical protein